MRRYIGESYVTVLKAAETGRATRSDKRGGTMVLTEKIKTMGLLQGATSRITVEPGTLAFPCGLAYDTESNGWAGCSEADALTEGTYDVTLLWKGDAQTFAVIEVEQVENAD